MKQRLSVPLFPFSLFRIKPNQRTHVMNKLLNHIHLIFSRRASAPAPAPGPSYRERVVKAEFFFLQTVHDFRGYDLYVDPVTLYSEQATESLVKAWDELMSLLTPRGDAGVDETNALLKKIQAALNESANPSAVKARDFIRALSTVRPFLLDGAVTGFALLTSLGRAGYRFHSEDIDDLLKGFDQQMYLPVTGAEWVASTNRSSFLLI